MHAAGQGVPQDHGEAVKWFRKAAEQGFTQAQNNLGAMYAGGQGVPRDGAVAIEWYRLAAAQGFAAGQYNLGGMYANGEGVPRANRQGSGATYSPSPQRRKVLANSYLDPRS